MFAEDGKAPCWARENEIESLIKPILKSERSATLLYGDSGIGKTTLLKTVKERLAGYPDVYVGFYQTSEGDPDPLLRSLDDLLHSIYTVEGALDQLRIACKNVKNRLSLTALKEFLLSNAFASNLGLGPFAAVIKGAFGWLDSLDVRVPTTLLPKLGVDVLVGVIDILREALPGKTLVLIIDNLSASAEHAEVRGFGSADTIKAFLSQYYSDVYRVHFVFSWKWKQSTAQTFLDFEEAVEEYKGRVVSLEPIQNAAALEKWLGVEFPWFQQLTEKQRQETISMTGGLPEIVVGWREADVSSYDPALLERLAKQVCDRKYPDLEKALENAPETDRTVIYSMALAPHPMAATSLSDLVGQTPQACLDILRKWTDQRLLELVDLGMPSASLVYNFQYDKKREVALDCLPATLANRAALDRRAYQFFLSHFTSSVDAYSDNYLSDALQLVRRSPALKSEHPLIPLLQLLFEWATTRKASKMLASIPWRLPESWPRNLQAEFFNLSLSGGFGNQEQVLAKLTEWISRAKPLDGSLGSAISQSTSLANLIFELTRKRRFSGRLDLVDRLVEELRILQKTYPDDADIALGFVSSLVYAFPAHMEARQMDKASSLLDEVRILYAAFPQTSKISVQWAVALANMIGELSQLRQMDKAEGLLGELRAVHRDTPFGDLTPLAMAVGLCNSIFYYCASHQMDKVEDLLDELRTLHREAGPENVLLRVELAKGCVSAIAAYGILEAMDKMEGLLSELRAVAQQLPKHAVVETELAQGLLNATGAYRNLKRSGKSEALLDELRALQKTLPQEWLVAKALALALANSFPDYRDSNDPDATEKLLAELRALQKTFPRQPIFAVSLARILVKAIDAQRGGQHVDRIEALLAELKALGRTLCTEIDVAECLANGLHVVLWDHGNLHHVDRMLDLLEEIRQIQKSFPDRTSIAIAFARSLYAAVAIHCESEIAKVEALLSELRALQQAFCKDVDVAEPLAKSLAKASQAYFCLQKPEKAEPLLNELRALHLTFENEALTVVPLAESLASLAPAYADAKETNKIESLLGELHLLYRDFPQEEVVRDSLASALLSASGQYSTLGQCEKLDGVLNELKSLQRAIIPQRGPILAALCGGYMNAVISCGRSGEMERLRAVLSELRAFQETMPAQPLLAEAFSMVLAQAVKVYSSFGDMQNAKAVTLELGAQLKLFPKHSLVAENLARAWLSLASGYEKMGEPEDRDTALGYLLGLLNGWPKLRDEPPFDALWEQLAKSNQASPQT